MSRRSYRQRTNINAAVWLIGLGILWLTDLWWPGILILIGISMLVQVTVSGEEVPDTPPVVSPKPKSEKPDEPAADKKENDIWAEEKDTEETPVFMQQPVQKDTSRLPEKCPACGGPVAENAHQVEWLGADTAKCPFCNTVLNL